MDVVIFFNGLGNQMSQYAFYLQKKSLHKSTYYISLCKDHNGLELDKIFGVNCKTTVLKKLLYFLFRILTTKKFKILTKPLQKLLGLMHFIVVKENFVYDFNKNYLIPSRGITYYFGGWHSEKYFPSVKDQLHANFKFNFTPDLENSRHIEHILSTNSIGIHVRRGDYLNADNLNLFGKVCTKSYFEKAVELIEFKTENPHFFVFSNDVAWVKSNISFRAVSYVTGNIGKNSWKDMYLMSLCKHNIISNSTFSWWGAWLNLNADKLVISPSRFLNQDEMSDVYCDSWIKLSDY